MRILKVSLRGGCRHMPATPGKKATSRLEAWPENMATKELQ